MFNGKYVTNYSTPCFLCLVALMLGTKSAVEPEEHRKNFSSSNPRTQRLGHILEIGSGLVDRNSI